MKYFIVKQDKDYKYAPRFINWFYQYDMTSYEQGLYEKLPFRKVIEIEAKRDTCFIDILSDPFFLVSDEVKKVLTLFEPNMRFNQILCLDRKNEKGKQYFMPWLPFLNCVSEKSEFNIDRSLLIRPVLEKIKIPDKGIFILGGVRSRYVIMRLDIVEMILRREVYGIELQEVELV